MKRAIVKSTGYIIALVFLLSIASISLGGEAITKKEIRVFIERQVLSAFENDEEIYSFDIVTGMALPVT